MRRIFVGIAWMLAILCVTTFVQVPGDKWLRGAGDCGISHLFDAAGMRSILPGDLPARTGKVLSVRGN